MKQHLRLIDPEIGPYHPCKQQVKEGTSATATWELTCMKCFRWWRKLYKRGYVEIFPKDRVSPLDLPK